MSSPHEIGGSDAAHEMSAGGASRFAAGAEAREGMQSAPEGASCFLDVSSSQTCPAPSAGVPVGAGSFCGRRLAFKARPRGRKAAIAAAIENNPGASDAALALRFGVSRQRVHQIRVECGLPGSGQVGGHGGMRGMAGEAR